MKNKAPIDREEQLQKSFNLFWNVSLKTEDEDYYSRMAVSDLINLKRSISCVNNIITLKTTLAFVDVLLSKEIITVEEADAIRSKVIRTNANANGYDVEYIDDHQGIIAEVKCNIPVNKDSFGAAQKNGIENDLNGLFNGKTKGTSDIKKYFKFMVLLNVEHVKESMEKIIKSYQAETNKHIEELELASKPLDADCVYIVYIDPKVKL